MDSTSPPRHKRIRLERALYGQVGTICSITTATAQRQPVFRSANFAETAVDVVRGLARETGVLVHGYCVMPDHVHLVLSPSDACNLITFVGQYKGLVQRQLWARGHRGKVWQVSFWDHFLRTDEQLESVVAYVLDNPVRAHLASHRREYPYSGTLTLAL